MIDAQTLETLRGIFSVDLIRLAMAGTIGAFIGELNRNYTKFNITAFLISFLSSAFMAVVAGIILKELAKLKSPLLEAVSSLLGFWGHKKTFKWLMTKKDKLLEKE